MPQLLIPRLQDRECGISEFYKRELDLEAECVEADSTEPISPNSLIFCYDIGVWANRLKVSKTNSVSVILSANEYYDVRKYRELNEFDAIKFAFIDYLPDYPIRVPLAEITRWIFENKSCLRERHFWGTLKKALKHFKELSSFDFGFPTMRMPLGYSERYVRELELLGLTNGSNESLLRSSPLCELTGRSGVSFIGQRGTWYRRQMTSSFSKFPGSRVETYTSWGGNPVKQPQTQYADSILGSRFVVCPPGNVSSESFRYMESIILGAIPILTEVSIQDFTRHNYWPKDLNLDLRTYMTLWKSLNCKNDDELSKIYFDLLSHLIFVIQEVKDKITELTSNEDLKT